MDEVRDRSGSARKPRADAQRNRTRLLEAAKVAFAASGPDVALDEIARGAGVGIGTLYRHFPTRDAVLEAVYRHEVQQLAEAAARLSETLPPLEALRAWMMLSVDYIATKKVVAPALHGLVGGSSELFAATGTQIKDAMALLVDRAVASGEIRLDIDPLDLLRALAGFANMSTSPGWEASARRLIDILVAGIAAAPR